MKISIKHNGSVLEMPDDTTVSIGNSGIVTLYNGSESTTFYFKRITTAESMMINCYKNTDFEVCQAFRNRTSKAKT